MDNIFKRVTIEKVSISVDYVGALHQLLLAIKRRATHRVARLILFGSATSNEEYEKQKALIDSILAIYFKQKPLWGYVIQRPLDADIVAEVTEVEGDVDLRWESLNGVRYLIASDGIRSELLTEAIASSTSSSISQQSFEIFDKLEAILVKEEYKISDIIRQWNYIERIVDFEDECQHYQIFNDARSLFYSKCDWPSGYPAATGIGMQFGGVIVEVNAIKDAQQFAVAIDNSLQIAAHEYSQDVLIGEIEFGNERTTPKFERAKMVTYSDESLFYISGTAAIQGEESLDGDDVVAQNIKTLQNIDNLISSQNRATFGGADKGYYDYILFRVYIKEDEDAPAVIDYMSSRYPALPISYIKADVCRCELLIEIEGIATIK